MKLMNEIELQLIRHKKIKAWFAEQFKESLDNTSAILDRATHEHRCSLEDLYLVCKALPRSNESLGWVIEYLAKLGDFGIYGNDVASIYRAWAIALSSETEFNPRSFLSLIND